MAYLINLSEKDYIRKKNKWLIKIKEWVDKCDPGALVIPFSGALELKLQELSAEERQKYLEVNMTQSALPKIIKAGFAALQLEYFFTAGPDEVRAWTIRFSLVFLSLRRKGRRPLKLQERFTQILKKDSLWLK